MNEIDEHQEELDKIYELICSGELINIELAYELLKNYKLDLNNWGQFFVRKSKEGSVSLYKSAIKKLDAFRCIGYKMQSDWFTNEKALKYYSENSKLKYTKYANSVIEITYGRCIIRLQISDPFSLTLIAQGSNSISTLDDLEQLGHDEIYLTSELKYNNIIEKYNKEFNLIEFYRELEVFIRKLWDRIAYNTFRIIILKNKLEYDWKNKTGLLLTYTYNNRNINVYNFHSHNTKCTVEYWYGKSTYRKVIKSRNIDLLVKDYAELISN